MKTITQYKQEQKQLAKQLEGIRAVAINEKRNPTTVELQKMHELVDKIEELDRIIEAESRLQETFEHLLEPDRLPYDDFTDDHRSRGVRRCFDNRQVQGLCDVSGVLLCHVDFG